MIANYQYNLVEDEPELAHEFNNYHVSQFKVAFSSLTDDECRMIIFKEPIPDKEMRGHVIKKEEVPNEGSCRVLCFVEPNCVSINFGPFKGGKYKCELNNATEENQAGTGLHKRRDYIYLGIEVSDC